VRIMIAGKRESGKAGKWEANSYPLPRLPAYPPLADKPNWASIRARVRHKPIIAAAGVGCSTTFGRPD
jgi:hypothetical protein